GGWTRGSEQARSQSKKGAFIDPSRQECFFLAINVSRDAEPLIRISATFLAKRPLPRNAPNVHGQPLDRVEREEEVPVARALVDEGIGRSSLDAGADLGAKPGWRSKCFRPDSPPASRRSGRGNPRHVALTLL